MAVPPPSRMPATDSSEYRTTVFDNANSAIPFRISKTDVGWNNRNGLWQINVVMKTSNDRGRTWSDSVCVVRGDEFCGCGDHPDTLQAWAVADVIGGSAISGREGTVAKAA